MHEGKAAKPDRRGLTARGITVLLMFALLLILNPSLQRFAPMAWDWTHGGPPTTPDLQRVLQWDTLRFWVGVIGMPLVTIAIAVLGPPWRRVNTWRHEEWGLCVVGLVSIHMQLVWTRFWSHDTRILIPESILRPVDSFRRVLSLSAHSVPPRGA